MTPTVIFTMCANKLTSFVVGVEFREHPRVLPHILRLTIGAFLR